MKIAIILVAFLAFSRNIEAFPVSERQIELAVTGDRSEITPGPPVGDGNAGRADVVLNVEESLSEPENHEKTNSTPENEGAPEIVIDATTSEEIAAATGPTSTALRQRIKNLENIPIMLILFSFTQLIMLFVEYGVSTRMTGSPVQKPVTWMVGPTTESKLRLGARYVPCMKKVAEFTNQPIECSFGECTSSELCGLPPDAIPNQWWRLFTAIFLHGGLVHLFINILGQFGGLMLELQIKQLRFALIYLFSGFFGSVLGGNYGLVNGAYLGASGAVMGIKGAMLSDLALNWKTKRYPKVDLGFFSFELSPKVVLGIISFDVICVVALGLFATPGVDNFAHIGGMFMGILLGFAVIPTEYANKMEKILKLGARSAAAATAIALQIMMLAAFYLNISHKFCPWCKYLACVPTDTNKCSVG